MPIEMPKGLPFSVDTWTPSSKRKRCHFLTHAHKDHSVGISTHFSYPIYSTHLTKSLLLQHYPQLDNSLFVGIEVGQSVVINDPDGDFSVKAFDANHCPGAVMFLFEGNFGNILHTGDCRLTPECLQSLPEKYIGKKRKERRCRLDYVFLDCTFGRFSSKIPSKHLAIQQVINCIWKHPDAPVVYLTCDLLGQEEILVNVSRTFGSKIYVDKANNPDYFQALTLIVPEILSQDPSSRFQVFDGFPKLYERAQAKLTEARANFQPEPLIIRPSAQWYACEIEFSETQSQRKQRFNEAVRDQFGVWHVCYSMHSSREELEWALQLLTPKRVVSTTPPCWAMELDYVKKHCFGTQLASDDPLWKLLDMNMDTSTHADLSAKVVGGCPVVEGPAQTSAESQLQPLNITASQKDFLNLSSPSKRPPVTIFGRATSAESQLQPVNISTRQKDFLNLSPPSKRSPVTLFGRARLGLQDFTFLHEEKENILIEDDPSHKVTNKIEEEFSIEEDAIVEVNCEKSLESKEDKDVEVQLVKTVEKETEVCKSASPSIGSSNRFSDSLRKLYRSMNVPVPRPLPSLVELMNANKRVKRRFEYQSSS